MTRSGAPRLCVLLVGGLVLQATPESPRMARLASDVAGGRAQALEQFWAELKTEGTPIYEPDDDPGRTLVTFVWRGVPATRNVLVSLDAVMGIASLQLSPLAGTDVWYRSYRLPSHAQVYYPSSCSWAWASE